MSNTNTSNTLYAVNEEDKIVADSTQKRFPVKIKKYEKRHPSKQVRITDKHPIMEKLSESPGYV